MRRAGWDELSQLREEVSFTIGRIIVRGKTVTRGRAKPADYILYYKPNIPLAVIEAKDNDCHLGDGLQQALEYAEALQLLSRSGGRLDAKSGGCPEEFSLRADHQFPP